MLRSDEGSESEQSDTTSRRQRNDRARHRRPQWRKRAFRWTAVLGVAALMSGGALVAVASPGDSSTASGTFLSGSLLSGIPLGDVAGLGGANATNPGNPTPVTDTSTLDLTALNAVNVQLPGGLNLPFGNFIQLGAVNQYAQASDAGVSRSASGAVGNDGAVSLDGSGAFPADATVDLTQLLGAQATGVLSTANLNVGAVTGVAALNAPQAPPATSCADLSSPVNCRDYNVANAGLNFTSPLVGQLVSSINGTLDTASGTVNGLSDTINSTILGTVGGVLSALSGGDSTVDVTINADLRSALAPVLSSSLSQGGVTLDLANGTITVDLAAVVGSLSNQSPNTPLINATVINQVVTDLGDILDQLQSNINTALTTALDNVNVTISGGICEAVLGCDPPLGGQLQLSYNGTLGDLASGNAQIGLTGTGAVLGLLTPVLDTLTGALGTALGGVVSPVITNVLSTVGGAVATDVTTLTDALDPVLQAISTVIGATLNVQEPGSAAGSYREVALRLSLLSGAGATVDLGEAEVGPNAAIPASISSLDPDHGPQTGGTVVTITGTGFTDATGVTFDGTPGTDFTVVDDSHITVTTPAHDPGAAQVVVDSPTGNSDPATFTFDPVPVISGIDPTTGPETGGTPVTINGTGFTGATSVTFDGVDGTALDVVSDTEIIVTSPPHAPGPVDVVVHTPNADSAPENFTYTPVTTIDGIDPAIGPEAGGTSVTISGHCFTGATQVLFGSTPATGFTVDSDGQITAVAPAGTGVVDVTVVGSVACGTATDPGAFTYEPAPAISSLNPNHGPQTGGTTVTIDGSGFTGATAVTLGGVAGTNLQIVSDTELIVDSPVHAPGAVDVVVSTPAGDSAPQTFTFDPVPSVTSIDPSSGPQTGGTVVTITGTGFTGASGVTFDGIDGTNLTVVSDTEIQVTTPAHTPGPVDVVVQGVGGNSTPVTYTYTPVTQVSGVSPGQGPELGGTTVTITGQCFTGATGVLFGTAPATSFTVDSDTQITAVAPAGTGTVDVTVVGAGTCGTGTDPGAYDYVPTPVISSLTPNHGPQTGGTTVTIDGTGFGSATGVTFDGIPGTSFVQVSDTEITVVTPVHAPGPVDVVVTDPLRDSDPQTYTFDPVVAVTGVSPSSGPEAGGTSVTITGQCFATASAVLFGATPATSFTVNSDTQITALAPAGTGVVSVEVDTTDCGTASLPNAFTYVAPDAPAITSLSPDHGPQTGGTVVTITGTSFTGATDVTFDGVPGTNFTVDSDTQITVTTPVHDPGAAQVTIDSPQGPTAPGTFTFDPVTQIDGVNPGSGPEAGGTSVTISGQCFTGATQVLFGTTPATSFTVTSDTEIVAVAPAGTGTVDVSVIGAGTCGTGTSPDAYQYVPAPVIQSLTPVQGPTVGGTSVVITGTGFAGATGVTFGATAATSFTVDSDTQITAVTPAHAAGAVDVTVSGPGGTSGTGTFTFVPPASIASISPSSGPETGGTSVTITGSGFTNATGVTFDGTAGGSFVVNGDTSITVNTPPHAPGAVDVVVLSPFGDSTPGTFTYTPVTTITGVSPSEGPEDGGTQVTITGQCLTGATGVEFGGVAATSFTVVSDTEIIAVTPAGTGTVDVVVIGSRECGTGTDPGGFTYQPSTTPIIFGLTPIRGPETGGTVVTITGANFTGATGATFDGLQGTSFHVDSDTQITVTSPPHVPQTVDVIVQGPNVQASPSAQVTDDAPMVFAAAAAITSVADVSTFAASNAGEFTYFAVSDVTSVDPSSGPTTGGTTVTISGRCFTGTTQVLFGTTAATSYTVVDDTTITAVTPAGSGTVDVTVVGAGDCGTSTLPGAFSYLTTVQALAATGGLQWLGSGILTALGIVAAGIALMVIRRRRTE
ncbi:IPT/TIG domain-containing protein [Humibacter soli]